MLFQRSIAQVPLSATHDRRPIKFIKWKQDWKSELKDAD